MNFDLIANNLLKKDLSRRGRARDKEADNNREDGKTDVLEELREAGFSTREIFQEIRSLYDNAEDDTTKKQLLDMVSKMHGLFAQTETKRVPNIILNVVGDKEKLAKMLCPSS